MRTLSDRIAVMYEGAIIGIVERNQATVEQIGLMMAGIAMTESGAALTPSPAASSAP